MDLHRRLNSKNKRRDEGEAYLRRPFVVTLPVQSGYGFAASARVTGRARNPADRQQRPGGG